MKRNSYYILGIICLAIIFVATVFKIMHLAGAGVLILAGLGSLTFLFLPIVYSALLKTTDDKLLKFLYSAALISFAIDIVGMAFKILHWPGAGIFMMIGIPIPFVLFLPAYVIYHNKRKLKTDLNFFAVLLFMIYLGVFSAFLAVSPNYEFLTAYANSTNELSEANRYISTTISVNNGNEISNSTEQLVKQIDGIKQNLIIAADKDNKSLVKSNESFNYIQVSGKDIKLSPYLYNESGFDKFNEQFEEYNKLINDKYPDKTLDRLIQEINDYRAPKFENDDPLIVKLPLISALNMLTDWQNKLLLISYIHS